MRKNNRTLQNRVQGQVVQHFQQEVSYIAGPIPPPDDLAKYDQIHPGLADRIMKMAEGQTEHRQFLEKKVIASGIISQYLGLATGFILGMTAIIGGIILIMKGKDATGIASICTSLVLLAGVFVYGKKKQTKELKEKNELVQKNS